MGNGPITLFCGNFGSGKTELAMAYAMHLCERVSTVLLDMDLVNPYFTSSHQRSRMEERGIAVVSSTYAATGSEVPSISREIHGAFQMPRHHVIIDLGGDPVGATAVGSLSFLIEDWEQVEAYFVLNACRPRTRTAEQAMLLLREIQTLSRVPMTGIINNTNLGKETDREILAMGNQEAMALSMRSGLPICYYGIMPSLLEVSESMALSGDPLVVERYNKPEWAD